MKKIFSFLIVCVLQLVSTQLARSQFLWDHTTTDFDGQYEYCYDVLDCYGNNCIIAGTVIDDSKQGIRRMFWGSTDAGLHWTMFDPKLDPEKYLSQKSRFGLIQQIDPLHIVAISFGRTYIFDGFNGYDSNLTLRSNDGGHSWNIIDSQLNGVTRYVHFFTIDSGLLVLNENDKFSRGTGAQKLFSTTDGGQHWNPVAAPSSFAWGKYIGNHLFASFNAPHGPVVFSDDKFQTIKTTSVLIDSADDPPDPTYNYVFNNCNFAGIDTIIAYGRYNVSGDWTVTKAAIMRSIDGGSHWSDPILFESVWEIEKMSPIDHDTVIAGGPNGGHILMSTNRGATWREDSLMIDTAYPAYSLTSIAIPQSGTPLAIYAFRSGTGFPSIVIRGVTQRNSVEWSGTISYHDRIFPNPATTTVNIASVESSTPYRFIDVLGRNVLNGIVGDNTSIRVDVASLPRGMYYVIVDTPYGTPILAGKLMLTGK